MNPVLIVAIPLVLIILGMILNSIDLSFDQPPSSSEQDPVKRLAAEREAFRSFFDRQRSGIAARSRAEDLKLNRIGASRAFSLSERHSERHEPNYRST